MMRPISKNIEERDAQELVPQSVVMSSGKIFPGDERIMADPNR